MGFKIAILSGGFTYFGNFLKQKYNIDYVYANELEIENGKLTGNHVGDIVDGKRKAELLRLIAQVENVDIRQTVAVGDGANDLPMISIAGLGIAFHAKPKVRRLPSNLSLRLASMVSYISLDTRIRIWMNRCNIYN